MEKEELTEFFGPVEEGYSLEVEVAGFPEEKGVKTYQVVGNELFYKYVGGEMAPLRILSGVVRVRAVVGEKLKVIYRNSEDWNPPLEFSWPPPSPEITHIYLRRTVCEQKAVNQ